MGKGERIVGCVKEVQGMWNVQRCRDCERVKAGNEQRKESVPAEPREERC